MKKGISILLISLFCFAFTTDVQKKMIRDNGFDIECYITLEKPSTFNTSKMYYWFKSGRIHESLSYAGGDVLHNSYAKYYRSDQIAEKGTFNYGLKIGIWQNWYENGQLNALESWKNGYKDGEFITYETNGDILTIGKYRNNLKVGKWINYSTKDTTYYKKDFKLEEKPKSLLQRVLRKRDSIEKIQIKRDKALEKRKDSIARVKIKRDRKIKKAKDSLARIHKKEKKSVSSKKTKKDEDGFFKKLFKKKEEPKKQVVKKN